jgi:hypothetical protein
MPLILAMVIIAFAAGFHALWAAGGRLGWSVSLPQHPDGTPVMARRLSWWRPAAGGIAVGLGFIALLLLANTGLVRLPLPASLVRLALLCVGVAFVCRALVPNRYVGFFKSLRTTRWAKYDTRLYSPLFLALGALILSQVSS